jgi:hypothetical protein
VLSVGVGVYAVHKAGRGTSHNLLPKGTHWSPV